MGEKYKSEDEANKQRIEAKNGVENYAYNMKNTMNDEKLKDKIEAGDKKTIEEKCDEVINWLDNNQSAEKEEYEEKQKELEGIMQKLYAGAGGAGGMPGSMPGGAPDAGADDAGPKIEEVD